MNLFPSIKVIGALFFASSFLSVSGRTFECLDDFNWAYQFEKWEVVAEIGDRMINPPYHRHYTYSDDLFNYQTVSYKTGVALWHLGRFREAYYLFEKSFSKFQNLKGFRSRTSLYHFAGLKGMASCKEKLEDYESAVRLSKKYLKETSARERRKPTPFTLPDIEKLTALLRSQLSKSP